VLAPGDPGVAMQLVDARDLAAFLLRCGERRSGGTVNATGPRGNASYGSWLRDCVEVSGSAATLTWVPDDVLLAHDVQPWSELPLWMPPGQDADAAWDADTAGAEAAGLRSRPVRETVADTWAWMRSVDWAPQPPPREGLPAHGIDPAKEAAILAAWRTRGEVTSH
jgi:2'-hydroxyisoflavone reductase